MGAHIYGSAHLLWYHHQLQFKSITKCMSMKPITTSKFNEEQFRVIEKQQSLTMIYLSFAEGLRQKESTL